jgi:segregation and condensation protein B
VEEERLNAILESLLFAAGGPVTLAQFAAVLDNVARDAIRKALAEMARAYAAGGRGLILEEVAGGYQLRTPKEHAMYVRKLLSAKPPRLSRPLLETLAIIAYRQPVTRPEIEQLRGVDSGAVLETLLERRFVRIAGRKEAPGRPLVYATTADFLEIFGLKDLESLPDLEEFRALEGAHEDAASESGISDALPPVEGSDLSGASLSEAPALTEAEIPTDQALAGDDDPLGGDFALTRQAPLDEPPSATSQQEHEGGEGHAPAPAADSPRAGERDNHD